MIASLSHGSRVLITGGAGFIGSHLADELIEAGYQVRVLDNLDPQVHGPQRRRPEELHPAVELVIGDVRDRDAVHGALEGCAVVCHLAAAVGMGQSMYEIVACTSSNCMGTAVLLQALTERPVQRLVVASSMSIYGEGLYRDGRGQQHGSVNRTIAQLRDADWEPRGPEGRPLVPLPTPESKPPSLASIYALHKLEQEQACLIVGRAYRIPTIALRLFNVYGPRQALSNPYTGVLAIFLSRLINGNAPLIYEDGLQQRDFVSVHDVARAFRLAIEHPARPEGAAVYNIGSGRQYTVREIASRVAAVLGCEEIEPQITGRHRTGDIRHCFADISRARRELGYTPRIELEEGIEELTGWLGGQIALDHVEEAHRKITARGLSV